MKSIKCLCFILMISSFYISCRKDSNQNLSLSPDYSSEIFFRKTSNLNPEVERIYNKLKKQNDLCNFVKKLPINFGSPKWDKVEIINFANSTNRLATDSAQPEILIPMTCGLNYLEGVLCLQEKQDSFLLKPITNQDLYIACYNQGTDTTKPRNLLSLFLYMNYKATGDSIFNNIPKSLFPTSIFPNNTNSTISVLFKPKTITNRTSSEEGPPVYVNTGEIAYCIAPHINNFAYNLGIAMICTQFSEAGGNYGGGGGGANTGFNTGNPNTETCPFYVNTCYQMSQHSIDVWNQLDAEDALDELNMNLDCQGTKLRGNVAFPGTVEHWLIQIDYMETVPDAVAEFQIPQASNTGSGYRGRADLANKTTGELFEIKPETSGGFNGLLELNNYILKANMFCPITPPLSWHNGIDYPYQKYLKDPKSPFGFIRVTHNFATMPGVLLYFPINSNPPPIYVPVAIPQNILDKLKQLIERIKANSSDFKTIIDKYLKEYPDLVYYLKNTAIGAAVAIVVGTIIEDIATLGVGIADDWASFALAYKIVRFAWAF